MPRQVEKVYVSGSLSGPSAIIIGGGIAGMATGCYLQMNGFNTHILERHKIPGGCCTAWERNGYVFDYCIEWLLGSGDDNEANQVWQELGALLGKNIKDFSIFNRVVSSNGEYVNFYNDPDKLEKHLLNLSPNDAKPIKDFCDAIRGFLKIDIYPELTPKSLQNWQQRLQFFKKVLPSFLLFWKTGATSLEKFSERISHPFLQKAMPFIFFQDHECFPILPYAYNMAEAHKGNAGFPEGGSLGLARSIEQRYLSLGGKISYSVKAQRILIKSNETQSSPNIGDQAYGVELKNGKHYLADYVVSAADGHTTLNGMLDGRYTSKNLTLLYSEMIDRKELVYPGVVSIFIGYGGEVGKEDPHSTTFLLDKNHAKSLPGCMQNSILMQHRSRFAKGFAPPDHSVIHLTYLSDFEPWQNWRSQDKKLYKKQKNLIEIWVRNFLEERYPGIHHKIDTIEIATPLTQRRYTGNTQGSILAWKAFTEAEDIANRVINKDHMQLPGLKNFYMAGQWVGGGGLIRAALSGRYVAQYLCAEKKQKFHASSAPARTDHWDNSEWQLGKGKAIELSPTFNCVAEA